MHESVPNTEGPESPREEVSRRDLLALTGSGALTLLAAGCAGEPSSRGELEPESIAASAAALTDPLYLSSTVAIASAIRRGEVSSEQIVSAFLARIGERSTGL